MREKERLESFLLCSIRGIGPASIKKLLMEAGSFEKIRELPDGRLSVLLGEKRAACLKRGMEEKCRKRAEERFYRMLEKGIFVLPYGDEEYPCRLRQIPDAPVILYGKGKLPEREKKLTAVIGTRECSAYGQEMAKYFAKGLAGEGVVIVSGMARGVDGLAQNAALYAGGSSVAVLGCGVDVCYPSENRGLYDRLEKEGCLLSEYPPGTEPAARLFPPRNRIISGLSDLILVIEARERSGTLITVDMALEQGRDVFAVPGRVTDRCSRGCNLLIKSGAGIAVSVSQILEELGGRRPAPEPQRLYGEAAPQGAQQPCTEEAPLRLQQPCMEEAPLRSRQPCMEVASMRLQQPCGEAPEPRRPEDGGGGAKALALRPMSGRVLAALEYAPKSLDEIQRCLNAADRGEKPVQLPELMQELVLLSMEGYVGRSAGMYYAKKGG